MKPWNIEICDVTLRDGEQTPGVSFTRDEKMAIALMLDEIGVEVIEAGFPVVSPAEKECVAAITGGLDARVCCLARALRPDIEAALDCDVDIVSIFIATSDLHIKHNAEAPGGGARGRPRYGGVRLRPRGAGAVRGRGRLTNRPGVPCGDV